MRKQRCFWVEAEYQPRACAVTHRIRPSHPVRPSMRKWEKVQLAGRPEQARVEEVANVGQGVGS